MKSYKSQDFVENPAWFVFRVDAQIQRQMMDIYLVMDLPSEMILGHTIVEDTISAQQLEQLMRQTQKYQLPNRILLAHGDPVQEHLTQLCKQLGVALEMVPAPYLDQLTSEVKQDIARQFFSPSSIPYTVPENELEECEDISKEDFLRSIPDSYDPCPCNSGAKYKFCCKKIFREVAEAMVALEDEGLSAALKWIEAARKIVGNTAEVLCREAIVYNYYDPNKAKNLIEECITKFPNYPRAYYIRGIDLKGQNKLPEAIKAYQTAIELYPKSDSYHLNEAYNNLGTALYESGDMDGAKSAWERALFIFPSDKRVKYNLSLCSRI